MGHGPAGGHAGVNPLVRSQAWQLRLAQDACRAGRLLVLAALALALFALFALFTQGQAHQPTTLGRACLGLAALALLPALYLGLRLELDRGLFRRLAQAQDTLVQDLAALDHALEALGWNRKAAHAHTRALPRRVAGVMGLLKLLGGVVGIQIVLAGLASLVS